MRVQYSILLALMLAAPAICPAQAYGELDLNDVRFRMFSDGFAGVRQGLITLEVPQGNGARALWGSGLWLAGVAPSGGLHTAAWLYSSSLGGGADFFPGPLRTDGTAGTTPSHSSIYDQVWVVNREEIAMHLAYFDCLNDPGCDVAIAFPGGYNTPIAIAEWPAMGDVADGYAQYLAPYYDYNLDGMYDAQDGDVPCILGDQAFFLVFNDNLAPHTESMGTPFGVEVQVMGFVYDGADPALDQTVFLRMHLINRSANLYEDFHLGYFNDIDIGCPNDDFMGTDPSRNLQFYYNWQDVDIGCLGALGYGLQPPAIGMTLIKGPLLDANGVDDSFGNALPAWNGTGFGDTILDNERHGLSHSIAFNRKSGNNAITDPSQPVHFANYLKAMWKDGATLTYGGNGYSLSPDAIPARYIFPGANDLLNAGTEGQIVSPWSETMPTPATPDRRGVMGCGALTLEPGEHIDLLYAYVYARAGSGGAFASVAALQARVDSVRAFAQTLPIWNVPENQPYAGMCADYATIGVSEHPSLGQLTLYPSPVGEAAHFIAPVRLAGGLLIVRDATGRVVLQQRILPDRNTIDMSALSKGVYLFEAVARNARFTGRIMKE